MSQGELVTTLFHLFTSNHYVKGKLNAVTNSHIQTLLGIWDKNSLFSFFCPGYQEEAEQNHTWKPFDLQRQLQFSNKGS